MITFLYCSIYVINLMWYTVQSYNIVTWTSGFRNMKHTRQAGFLHHVDLYLSNDILPKTSYKTTIKSLHNETVSQSISPSAPNNSIPFPQIAAEGVILPLQDFLPFPSSVHLSTDPSVHIVRASHKNHKHGQHSPNFPLTFSTFGTSIGSLPSFHRIWYVFGHTILTVIWLYSAVEIERGIGGK